MKLKLRYDGYHFSEDSPEIYNPFSLLKAFQQRKVTNYWFDTGTPSYLIQQLRHFKTDIMSLDSLEAFASDFDLPTEAMRTALPLLYQAGYLTIKDYERESEMYTLAIPNQEVRTQVKVWSSESHTSSLEDDRVATELGKAKCAGGRTDMVVWMPDTTYVFELKLNDTAQHALEQIDSKGYDLPYLADGRRVVKVGVSFDADTRTPKDWIIS